MPGLFDKILHNSNLAEGTANLIETDFTSLQQLATEIADLDMLKETMDLRDKLAKYCTIHDAAEMDYHKVLQEIAKELDTRINKKRGLLP